MGSFSVDGMDGLETMFDNLAEVPLSVIKDMLEAQGDVVVEAQKGTAQSMLQGPYNQNAVAGSVSKGKFKGSGEGGSLEVEFKGSQHGNRLAEIAFINEFGKESQPARPFIQTANEKSAEETTQAAQEVFDKWTDSL